MPPKDDDRVSIPLHMIRGNMEILLEKEMIACNGVSLNWYGPAGVVLVFHTSAEQKEEAIKRGFQFRRLEDDSR